MTSLSDKTDMRNCEEGESMLEDEDAEFDTLPPHMHDLMLANERRSSCCPQLFERSSKSWWNPRFDSDILEQQYTDSSLPKLTTRFRYALLYAFLSDFIWCIYWLATDTDLWANCALTAMCIAFLILLLFVYSHHKYYKKHQFLLSCVACILLMVASLLPFGIYISKYYRSIVPKTTLFVDLSAPTIFTFYIEVLLLVYTVIPLPLYLAITLCTLYSIVFETLNIVLLNDTETLLIIVRALLHITIHLTGAHIMIMNEVRMRGTFMSVGQSLLVNRQCEIEKALKLKMIHSVMPTEIATWLMGTALSDDVDCIKIQEDCPVSTQVPSPRLSDSNIHGESFRPFNMNVMDNVSILFADIVGFTRMSSNKTAEHLVGLLNDLFGRFDQLCSKNGCEKINTLGDCYYAVSGCPEARPDHAECCVNMGLDMVTAIKEFDASTNEDVNMRVGVHTGKVLCGIVGTMRFKYDVWSRDVTFANQMESTGRPGQVHITDVTRQFLPPDAYIMEEGPVIQAPSSQGQGVKEHKTYFISARAPKAEKDLPQKVSTPTLPPKPLFTVPSDISTDLDSSRQIEWPETDDDIIVSGSLLWDEKQRNLDVNSFLTDRTLSLQSKRVAGFRRQLKNDLEGSGGSGVEMKSSSLPNMIDTLAESDGKGDKTLHKSTGESSEGLDSDLAAKVRYTIFTNRDLLKFRLPKLSRSGGKSKTISLPKITTGREDQNMEKSVELECRDSTTTIGAKPYPRSTLTPGTLPLTSSSSPPSPTPAAPPPTPRGTEDGDRRLTLAVKDPRKDSGIRTGSRRSSIQEQIFAMNGLNTGDLLVNRVSDYFTASRSTISDVKYDNEGNTPTPHPGTGTLNECEKKFLQMRKQSDLQMIKCVQQERESYKSPLSPISLFFKESNLEKEYHQRAHQPRKEEPKTLSSGLYNTYFDILISALTYLSISLSLLLFGVSIQWLVLFIMSACWYLFILTLSLYKVVMFTRESIDDEEEHSSSRFGRLYHRLTQWNAWHACGASLLCLPMIIVFANFSCDNVIETDYPIRYFCYIFAVSLIHFCNFTQLNCWMKNVLATVGTVIFLSLVGPPVCSCPYLQQLANMTTTFPLKNNASSSLESFVGDGSSNLKNITSIGDEPLLDLSDHWFHVEVIIAYVMLLLMVWLLNREFEISYRLSFYSYVNAVKDKMKGQNLKSQTEWLLHNIIPPHVANIIKTTAKYSKNHRTVGVMFASVVNFNELYNEDYSSGKEYLRFLNELVADFDELLTKEQFRNVEKIKTIGSTYMAASGLNPRMRMANAHQYQHVCDLVDFAREMFQVLENFNQNMIGFKFVLRIGLNCGDVTAGVIGTTKLFYDIWGDAVNIASRMDSTGVCNKIQVIGETAKILRPLYRLEPRGNVFVKGKGNMDVYLINFDSPVTPTKEEEEKER